jgi:peptide/nickel transport system permease protein
VRDFWRALRRNRLALIGGVVVACLALLAILAPVIAPWDPNRPDVKKILNPPSHRHVFGTDQLGRDVLSRMLYGARVSLAVGFVSVGSRRPSASCSARRPDITADSSTPRSCGWST